MVNPLNPLDFGLDYYIANKPNGVKKKLMKVIKFLLYILPR